jgi:flagellar biosynthesis protein FlhB
VRKLSVSFFFTSAFLLISQITAAATLGSVSNKLNEGVHFIGSALYIASFGVGAFLIMSAISRFFRWRKNSMETSLITVIFSFLLGLALVAIPFIHTLVVKAAIATGQGSVINQF